MVHLASLHNSIYLAIKGTTSIALYNTLLTHIRKTSPTYTDEHFNNLMKIIKIKEVSKKLGIQFIIITHEPILASYADKVFETKIRKGITQVI